MENDGETANRNGDPGYISIRSRNNKCQVRKKLAKVS